MSIRIATISVTVGLILGATLFGASQSEAESVFSSSSEQNHTNLNLVQQQLNLDAGSLTELVANTGAGKSPYMLISTPSHWIKMTSKLSSA
jgi:hypothetical protein